MPALALDEHMKRKHPASPADQVDAIGTMADAMSMKIDEKPMASGSVSSNNRSQNSIQKAADNFFKPKPTNFSGNPFQPAKDDFTLSQQFQSALSFGAPKSEMAHYTIRVTEAQMQQLLDQNRIYPKDGTFYLK